VLRDRQVGGHSSTGRGIDLARLLWALGGGKGGTVNKRGPRPAPGEALVVGKKRKLEGGKRG